MDNTVKLGVVSVGTVGGASVPVSSESFGFFGGRQTPAVKFPSFTRPSETPPSKAALAAFFRRGTFGGFDIHPPIGTGEAYCMTIPIRVNVANDP